MNLGQACRPCRGLCSLIPRRGCFGDLLGDEIVVSPPSLIVGPLGFQDIAYWSTKAVGSTWLTVTSLPVVSSKPVIYTNNCVAFMVIPCGVDG